MAEYALLWYESFLQDHRAIASTQLVRRQDLIQGRDRLRAYGTITAVNTAEGRWNVSIDVWERKERHTAKISTNARSRVKDAVEPSVALEELVIVVEIGLKKQRAVLERSGDLLSKRDACAKCFDV
eukprot:6086746-Pleurochrysis_carterae.AAC.1